MSTCHSKNYRYKRWSLVKMSAGCLSWLLVGLGIALLPIGLGRWTGLLPGAYSVMRWHFVLYPKWKYVVRLQADKLVIGSKSHLWSQLDQLQFERIGQSRYLHLSNLDGTLDIEIKDDLPDFDSLAQNCLLYMNRKDEPLEPEKSQPNSGSSLSGIR